MFGAPMKWLVDPDGARMMARVQLPTQAATGIHRELIVQAWGPDRATADSQRAIAETLNTP
jgi:hypothetical protein